MKRRSVTGPQDKTLVAVAPPIEIQSSRSQLRSHPAGPIRSFLKFGIWQLCFCLGSAAVVAFATPAYATEAVWKDGIMFTQEDLGSLQGHKAVKIAFGLAPGKCTGELTAVSEWLKMTQGKLVQTYPGKGDVERVTGDEWFQENGTKVSLCNRSDANAVLVGVQFKRE